MRAALVLGIILLLPGCLDGNSGGPRQLASEDAAALLEAEGYTVVGYFMDDYSGEDLGDQLEWMAGLNYNFTDDDPFDGTSPSWFIVAILDDWEDGVYTFQVLDEQFEEVPSNLAVPSPGIGPRYGWSDPPISSHNTTAPAIQSATAGGVPMGNVTHMTHQLVGDLLVEGRTLTLEPFWRVQFHVDDGRWYWVIMHAWTGEITSSAWIGTYTQIFHESVSFSDSLGEMQVATEYSFYLPEGSFGLNVEANDAMESNPATFELVAPDGTVYESLDSLSISTPGGTQWTLQSPEAGTWTIRETHQGNPLLPVEYELSASAYLLNPSADSGTGSGLSQQS